MMSPDDAGRAAEVRHIMQFSRQDVAAMPMIPAYSGQPYLGAPAAASQETSAADHKRAIRLATNEGTGYEAALAKLRQAAHL